MARVWISGLVFLKRTVYIFAREAEIGFKVCKKISLM